VATLTALLAPLVHQLISLSVPASRTSEPIWPPASGQILLAGFRRSKVSLKLAKRSRERRSWHAATLLIVAC
jgi:hypothetical protein